MYIDRTTYKKIETMKIKAQKFPPTIILNS
jgi:hypothetical protein